MMKTKKLSAGLKILRTFNARQCGFERRSKDKMNDKQGVFSGEMETYVRSGQPTPSPQFGQQGYPLQGAYPQHPPMQPLEKKPTIAGKIFGGIALSFVIMMLAMGVQFVVAVVMMIVPAFQYAIQAPGDVAYVTRKLTETIQDENFMANLTVIATAVSAVVMLFLYWIIYGRKKPQYEKQYFREKVLTEKNALMFVITTVGLYFLALLISEVIGFISPATMEAYNEMMDMAFGDNIMAMVLAAVLLAPISEECVMRGLILKNLQNYFSVPAVIIIQAILFGIFHMNWVQGIYVLPVGAVLGFVAVKSKSVLPSIVMHMLYNSMSLVVGLLPAVCQTAWFYVIAVAVCTAAVWLIWKRMDKAAERAV